MQPEQPQTYFDPSGAQVPAAAPAPAPVSTDPPAWATQLTQSIEAQGARLDELKTQFDSLTQTQPEYEDTAPAAGWQPQTWDDIPAKAAEIADQVAEEKLAQRDQAAAEAQQAQQAQLAQYDQYLDGQVAQLEQAGRLPAIANPNDTNDPGRAARRELFGLAADLGTDNLAGVANQLDIAHRQGLHYNFETKGYTGNQPAGAMAPVGSSNSSAGHASQQPAYNEIATKSMTQLARDYGPRDFI